MNRKGLFVAVVVLAFGAWAAQAVAQTAIQTDGNIETDAQLVSKVTTGTAPLAVSSTTMVPSLNADQVDGVEGSDLALDADLQSAEAMLVALQVQVDALGLALVPRTGQSAVFAAGDDGDLQLGVTWPNPRFTKNGDGTVTDNLTGLIWLENADCAAGGMNWAAALAFANTLFDGSTVHNGGDCGLSDASAVGAWRLPNQRELYGMLHFAVFDPSVPNTAGTGKWVAGDPFSGVQSSFYWSSTTNAGATEFAWSVTLFHGAVNNFNKIQTFYVWPVRDGQ